MRKKWLLLVGIGLLAGSGCSSDPSSGEALKECTDSPDGVHYSCKSNELCCMGGCVVESEANCGVCGNKCGDGSVCLSGACICETTQKFCSETCTSGGCVNVKSNPNHCGAAEHKCGPAEACNNGVCASSCSEGLENCNGQCRDTNNDVESCGACGVSCVMPDGTNHIARSYCMGGECRIICQEGYADADGVAQNGCEQAAAQYKCGNGVVEAGEMCDGLRLNDQTCATVVGEGSTGVLKCRADCLGFDSSSCSASTTCGNNVIDGAEMCDGAALGGATCASVLGEGSTGHLGCNTNCSDFDTRECEPPTLCGNGNLDPGEICDGSQLKGATCATVVGAGSTGELKCAKNCHEFDRGSCTAASICGNGILEAGESCDGSSFNGETCETLVGPGSKGKLLCNGCSISVENCSAPSSCGNNVIDGQEKCDGTDLNSATCESVVGAGSTGNLACRDNCSDFDRSGCTRAATCGNGIIEEGEVCDGSRLNDRTCATEVGFGSTGTLLCKLDCSGFVTTGCSASTTCGNGILEAGEVCDTNRLNGATCDSEVGSGSVGTVLCGTDCKSLNLSGCSAATQCGNGTIDTGEVCDGSNLNGKTCADIVGKGSEGVLQCGDGCRHFSVTACSKSEYCGNGTIEDGEMCDDTNLAGRTCADVVGFGSKGVLKCSTNCMEFDTSMCTAEVKCGNGKLDTGEVCDGELLNGATCSAQIGYGSVGTLKCNSTCSGFVMTGCSEAVKCGNGVLDEGEVCDGGLLNGKTCAELVGFGSVGLPACNSSCSGFTNGTCTAAVKCGNGILDEGEKCDTNLLNGATCESVVGVGSKGTLLCDSNCNFNTTQCTASRGCGNGTLEDGEECDGKVFASGSTSCNVYAPALYSSGKVSCLPNCQVDVSQCVSWCGNDVLNVSRNGVYIGETCDTTKFPSGQDTCAKVVGAGSEGQLTCSSDCRTIGTSQCTEAARCGDGKLNQASEACDGSVFRAGTADCSAYSSTYEAGTNVTCLGTCEVDTTACKKKPYCGDGIINNDEECDGTAFIDNDTNCSSWSNAYESGQIKCKSDCTVDVSACKKPAPTCGNGKLDADEFCDGKLFYDNITCAVWDSKYEDGPLGCKNCEIDESVCKPKRVPTCGDGIIDKDLGEECDGTTFDNKYCKNYDSAYKSGELKCTSTCKIDVSACKAYCGDGTVSSSRGEECDINEKTTDPSDDKFNTSMNTCEKIRGKGYAGTLKCKSDCKIDSSECKLTEYCGDGIVNGTEVCDGTNFKGGNKSCNYWNSNYDSGEVKCKTDCTLDESACVLHVEPKCGDGVVNQANEECDGTKYKDNQTACTAWDSTKYASGTVGCNKSTCKVTYDGCVAKVETKCGNGKLDEDDDEFCDGDLFSVTECSDWSVAYSKGKLKCTKDCQVDTSGCTVKSCGDGVLANDEFCDTNVFDPDLDTCAKVSNAYKGGTLSCNKDCTINEDACIRKCGNGELDDDEFCDGTKFIDNDTACSSWQTGSLGTVKCTNTCEIDTTPCVAAPTAYCGDGIRNTNAEECDGADFKDGVKTCAQYSDVYSSGNLGCTSGCRLDFGSCVKKPVSKCGNGTLDDDEACDGSKFLLNITTCADYSSSYSSGKLKCTDACTVDVSGCVAAPKCGNGLLESGELCDGLKFKDNKTDCSDWGDFVSGTVSCSASCDIVKTNCVKPEVARCGDNKINQSTEACDGTAFVGDVKTCAAYNSDVYSSGNLKCTNCQLDFSSCVKKPTSLCGNKVLDDNEFCDGSQFMEGISKCSDYSRTFTNGNLKCTSSCDFDISECLEQNKCTPDDIRCSGSSLQMCDDNGQWVEITNCNGSTPVCDESVENCVEDSTQTVYPAWCNFQWLTTDENHYGYGRMLIPEGQSVDNLIGYMACTNDLSKPVLKSDGRENWKQINADHNMGCTDCGSNVEFMTDKKYLGESGTNYCTFVFQFLDDRASTNANIFACRPIQSGESAPILIIPGTTKLSADMTRTFDSTSCPEGLIRCSGSNVEMCVDGVWGVMDTCTGSTPVCNATTGECEAAGVSYDHTVTMNDWYTKDISEYKTTKASPAFADGSKVTVTGGFYVATHIIDGVTAILNAKNTYSTKVVIDGLTAGVGMVSFKYATWGSSDSATLNVTDGTTTKTLEVTKTDTAAKTATFTFNNSKAKTVTISPVAKTTAGRVLIDDIRWTSSN